MFDNEDGEGDVVAETTPTETAASAAWDGDFAKIDTQPWWSTIPDEARPHILKAHEERTEASARASYLDNLFKSDDAVAAVRAELEAERSKLASLQEALSKTEGAAKEHETRAAALEARIADQELEQSYAASMKKYPDIFADVTYIKNAKGEEDIDPTKGAYPRFVQLIVAGMSEEDAAVAARAFLTTKPAAAPERPKERPTEIPKSVLAAKPGGGNTVGATVSKAHANMTLDAKFKQAKREAEEDAAALEKAGG